MVGKKIRESIFLKLFFTVIFTTILLKLIFFAGLKTVMKPHIETNVKSIFVGYTDLLFEDVEHFDSTKAMEIAEKSGMIVIYKDSVSGEVWSSSEEEAYFLREFNRFYVLYEDDRFGFRLGRVHTRVFREGGEFLLVTNMKHAVVQLAWLQILLPFIGILIVAVLSYWLLRQILQPVKAFMVGADQFGAGNFDHRIDVNRNDEFGKLAKNFNSMGKKLSQLVEEKEQLLLDISHEMKTPITRSTMALEFLPDSDFKERIGSDLKELNRMITEILETERLKSNYGGLSLEPVRVDELVSSIVEEYKFKSPVPIELDVQFTEEVAVDKERIRRVFSNIIGNALKYSCNNSQAVTVSLRKSENDELLLFVRDCGIGIEKEELERIFEPFYRVDKNRSKETGGYGLGLHLCKKIVEAHKGEIHVESTPGEGTTMKISIPLEHNDEER